MSRDDDDEMSMLVAQAAEEFTQEIESGSRPSVEVYATRYPEIADVLRGVLPALNSLNENRKLDETAIHGNQKNRTTDDLFHSNSHELLGDFQLEEPIGRGGMGVVYRATQISIGRRVAVKVLPFAATLDSNQLQRFRNEVRAAGALNHSNIVPIYSVGEQRGVHFYAMQLIDGCSMAELIESLQPPEMKSNAASDETVAVANALEMTVRDAGQTTARIRQAAVLGRQAALGLAHAHACGVTHRDVKPANLLIDRSGKLWITDFGLAHVESGQSLTMPGDFIGTLRFMSPEQASGSAIDVDFRTDIYSLGISLYELLTGRPAIRGDSREQILAAVRDTEPERPRRLEPGIPVELETIVQKCYEKDPYDRYTSAEEVADDLERFLTEKPIVAKRRNGIDKAKRWTRKNSLVVLSTALVTSMLLAITCGATVWIWHERNLANASMRAEHAERKRADITLASAREAMDLYVKHAASLGSVDGMTPKQRESLLEVLRFYESLPTREFDDPEIAYDAAFVRNSLGNVNRVLGNYQQAHADLVAALSALDRLQSLPGNESRGELLRAKTLLQLGIVEGQIGKEVHVAGRYRHAISVLEDLRAIGDPAQSEWAVPLTLASAKRLLAQRLIQLGKHEEAANMAAGAFADSQLLLNTDEPSVLNEVLTIRHENAAILFHAFGLSASRIDLEKEMGETYKQAKWLLDRFANERASAALVARIAFDYSLVSDRLGKRNRAFELIQEAIALREELATRFPNRASILGELALARDRYASLLHDERRFDEAIEQYRLGIELDERLGKIDEYAKSLDFRETAIGKKQNLSNVLYRTRNPEHMEECRQLREESVQEWSQLVQTFVDRVDLKVHQAMARYALAECKTPDEAIKLVSTSIEEIKHLVTRHPQTPQLRARLTTCLNGLAAHYHRKRAFQDAIPIVREAIEVAEKLVEEFPNVADYQGKVARRYYHLGRLTLKMQDNPSAVSAFRKTVEIRQTLRERFPEYKKPMHAVPNASAEAMLGISLRRLSQEDPEAGHYSEAMLHLDKAGAMVVASNSWRPLVTELQVDKAHLAMEEIEALGEAIARAAQAAKAKEVSKDVPE